MTGRTPASWMIMAGCSRSYPVYGGILIFTSMASLGLPGLNGFVSEFMIVRGVWPIFTLFIALGMIGLLFTGVYVLKALKLTLHGPLNENWKGKLKEISLREILVIAPLMLLMLSIGIWPAWILNRDQSSCDDLVLEGAMMQIPLLSILASFFPSLPGSFCCCCPQRKRNLIRGTALGCSIITLLISVILFFAYD